MKKRLIILLGCLVMLVVACGTDPEPEPTAIPVPAPTATLTEEQQTLQDLVPSAEQLAVGRFVPVQIEELGMQAVVPNSWPPIVENAALQYGWGINQLNFVAFDSEPGEDPVVVLEEWVGLSAAEMDNGAAGFTFTETPVGPYDWVIFTRQNEENEFYAFVAVTVVDGEAYLMALFAPYEAGPDIAKTIIESVNIQ